ncbi:MAG: protein-ADP-ribose hydrolase [Clostridia bacterium]|nr:protein-ADP-ribose hydrolase [Clostridia bacterium]
MNQEEKRLWLIRRLLAEDPQYKDVGIPEEAQRQRDLLRALMNVREAAPVDDAFLQVQDAYLSEENRSRGITDAAKLRPCAMSDRLFLWQGDITTLRIDAIVNAANSGMTGCYQPLHNCIDNIIGSRAGVGLRLHLSRLMEQQGHPEPAGRAKITPGFNLPCKYIIHTVGPIVEGELTPAHEQLLASCYRACLDLARENRLAGIAFCCISTGVFCFPNRRAAEIAVETVRRWQAETGSGMQVVFNVFKDLDREIYEQLLNGPVQTEGSGGSRHGQED